MARKINHRRQGSIELLEAIRVVKKENGTGSLSMLLLDSPKSFDYVLVAQEMDKDTRKESSKKKLNFISALKEKNLQITKIADDDKVFYGITAPKEIFETYRYLLKVSDACNWSSVQQGNIPQSTRIRIVEYILHHTCIECNGK
ncbi:anoctamin-9 [Tachysurus ichikawai]